MSCILIYGYLCMHVCMYKSYPLYSIIENQSSSPLALYILPECPCMYYIGVVIMFGKQAWLWLYRKLRICFKSRQPESTGGRSASCTVKIRLCRHGLYICTNIFLYRYDDHFVQNQCVEQIPWIWSHYYLLQSWRCKSTRYINSSCHTAECIQL